MSKLSGKTELLEHKIETGDAKPVRLPPYHLPHAYRDTIKKELEEMEKYGIIEKSSSDCIVLVKKKDGALHSALISVDLHVTGTDAYPMPCVDECVHQYIRPHQGILASPSREGSPTKNGIQDSLWTIPVPKDASPSTFQRMMDSLLVGMQLPTLTIWSFSAKLAGAPVTP